MSAKEEEQGDGEERAGIDGGVLLKTDIERLQAEQAEDKRRENRYRKRQLLFNGILTIATVVSAGIASYQGYLLREYTRLTKISADAATKAAKAAEDSVNVALDTGALTLDSFKFTQRAWIAPKESIIHVGEHFEDATISGIRVTSRRGLSSIPIIEATLFNSGLTPAVNVKARVKISFRPTLVSDNEEIKIDTPTGPVSNAIVARDGLMSFARNLQDPLSMAEMILIQKRKAFLVIFGKITYSDVFGKDHWTKFCYEYSPPANQMSPCAKHNDMDRQ